MTAAARLSVRGVVQGVGFRPFVHRLALRRHLAGWVRNASGDVQIHIEGSPEDITAFVRELQANPPGLARVQECRAEPCAPAHLSTFEILASRIEAGPRQPICPDVAICAACEAELCDPRNRRYRYPFITCTDCGPRFTMIDAMPYDREHTSMRAFTQCDACLLEYETPGDRRYHSQTNSCPACGPRLWVEPFVAGDPLAAAARVVLDGGIVAVRGLGGFHLCVDATAERAVERLRTRKHREAKPLAVMVRSLAEARGVALIDDAAAALLCSRERPIVLLPRRAGARLASAIAPGLDTVGIVLAYTPLHHLLCERARRPLVMTSGNRSEEPIAISNADARARLAAIADTLLLHEREILARYDDSVMRVAAGAPLFLRRARGYAPLPLQLPVPSPTPLVAVGPHLKNTFTLAQGTDAYVAQHIGDLENLETLDHWRETLGAYRRLFGIEPEVAVRDLHPGYMSTRAAAELGLARIIAVQHHHAHIAAVLAEHGVTGRAIGIAFDGAGYGDDGTVWGAEFLEADLATYRRVGHLRYAALPGGDLAAREPWRAAIGYLALDPAAAPAFRLLDAVRPDERAIALRQIERRLNAPLASSMGRLFDAAGAVLGISMHNRYEGQTAMLLESLAGSRPAPARPLPFPVSEQGGCRVLDPLPLLVALGEQRARGVPVEDLAAQLHDSIAAAAAQLAAQAAADAGVNTIALGGGCFQNALLLGALRARLETRGLRVLVPRQLSPNDGAVSYGQAASAAAILHGAA